MFDTINSLRGRLAALRSTIDLALQRADTTILADARTHLDAAEADINSLESAANSALSQPNSPPKTPYPAETPLHDGSAPGDTPPPGDNEHVADGSERFHDNLNPTVPPAQENNTDPDPASLDANPATSGNV